MTCCCCRHWVSGDDLGTRAEAALDKAADAAGSSPDRLEGSVSTQGSDPAGVDDACHPADPYCTAGEAPPRADDFHEEGDGTTPPSSGFPA